MRKRYNLFLLLLIPILVWIVACGDNDDNKPTPMPSFDRKVMLENIGNNIIIPNYHALQNKVTALDMAWSAFSSNTNTTNLIILRDTLKETFRAWQLCSVFEFGPAENELLRSNLNIFPTDTSQIHSNIEAGSYDLSSVSNIDAKGFPALDYLFFGLGDNVNDILVKYTTDTNAPKRKAYVSALVSEIKSKVSNTYNAWLSTGGNYISTFSNNTGTDIGSSIGNLVNQLNYDLETIKNAKLGIPLGKKTLGTPLPEKTEAYYSEISSELMLKNYQTIENIFLGKGASGNDGSGLDDYLTYLNAQYNGGSLTDAIKAQFSTTKNKLQLLADPLSATIINDPAAADNAYTEIQKTVVLLKVDMTSAMGVLITYQDNDGD